MKKILASAGASIILFAAGICLIVNPDFFIKAICYFIGGFAILTAAFKFISAYRKNALQKETLSCVVLFVLGVILIVLQGQLINVIPLTVGICFLIHGLLKLKAAFAFRKTNPDIFKNLLYSSIIGIILAVIIICISNSTAAFVTRLLGVLLIYNALENIFSAVVSGKSSKDGEDQPKKKKKKIEAEFEEKDADDINSDEDDK